MASRHELPEGAHLIINGVPVVVVIARGRRLVLAVGGYDADGLLDGPDDVKRAAARWRGRLDEVTNSGED